MIAGLSVTVHSYKGGTGKSIVSANLAQSFSTLGKTALIDSDCLSPCLEAFFEKTAGEKTFLDFLEGNAEIKDIPRKTEYENLWLLPAPPAKIGKDVLAKDRQWHSKALQRLLHGIAELRKEYAYVIIDNQSGISLLATNNLAASEASLLVLRPVSYGMEGTAFLMGTLYQKLRHLTATTRERKDYVLWNQVPSGDTNAVKDALAIWNTKYQEKGLAILPMIPYQDDISLAMLLQRGSGIFASSHPFKRVIQEVRDVLLKDSLEN
ncbi:MAG: ParA family protein [Candidatus Hodarchaeota archaeon]